MMLFSGNLDMSPNSVKVFCTEAKDLSSDLKPTWMLAISVVLNPKRLVLSRVFFGGRARSVFLLEHFHFTCIFCVL